MNSKYLFVGGLTLSIGLGACFPREAEDGPRDDTTGAEAVSRSQGSTVEGTAVQPEDDGAAQEADVQRGVTLAPKNLAIPQEALVPDTLSGDVDCERELEAPKACTWASAADAVVLAEVAGLRLVTGGAVGADGRGGWRAYPDCAYPNPALAIDLRVESVLAGSAPEVVTLMVGAEQVAHFKPLPLRADDGAIVWAGTDDPSTGPLRAGARVVVATHRMADVWSLKGDVILGVDAEGVVHLPRRTGDCLNTLPQEIDGSSVIQVANRLARCDAENRQSIARRQEFREALWGEGQGPWFYAAPYCTDSVQGFEDSVGRGPEQIDSPEVRHVTE